MGGGLSLHVWHIVSGHETGEYSHYHLLLHLHRTNIAGKHSYLINEAKYDSQLPQQCPQEAHRFLHQSFCHKWWRTSRWLTLPTQNHWTLCNAKTLIDDETIGTRLLTSYSVSSLNKSYWIEPGWIESIKSNTTLALLIDLSLNDWMRDCFPLDWSCKLKSVSKMYTERVGWILKRSEPSDWPTWQFQHR